MNANSGIPFIAISYDLVKKAKGIRYALRLSFS